MLCYVTLIKSRILQAGLADLDLEGYKFETAFNSKHASEEDVEIVEGVAVLLRLTLILNIHNTKCNSSQNLVGNLILFPKAKKNWESVKV